MINDGSRAEGDSQSSLDSRSSQASYNKRGIKRGSAVEGFATRISAALNLQAQATLPGPIAAYRANGAPPLSWFEVPVKASNPQTFVAYLERELTAPSREAHPAQVSDAASLMQRVRDLHALDPLHLLPARPKELQARSNGEHVLIIDEREHAPFSTLSRRERVRAFRQLLQQAMHAHPNANFWLGKSTHGGHGKWLSTTTPGLLPTNIRHLGDRETLCASIDQVDRVYTVCAQDGLHALLSGVPLSVFGAPYYAGWGLTHDARTFPERRARPSLSKLFDVVFLRIARYLDPASRQPGNLESLLDTVAIQRRIAHRFAHAGPLAGIGFQWWKRPFVTPFLSACGQDLRWTDDAASVRANECAVIWGGRSAPRLPDDRRRIRIEDGFLHSLGLGSDMNAPHSQVIDTRGLYFDASRPSDLTVLLNEAVFPADELARAARLRESIIANGLTKYNLGRKRPRWTAPNGACVILVPGQVADDASIRLGTRTIRTADALLREVRARRPEAWIVYKPHPDVLSGNRNGIVDATALADVIDVESDLISLIEVADEVHTLSSLSGFEALIRKKDVFTYGLPFYAGWGLTNDAITEIPWRERVLSLDMLTAGVLLRYPLYWDWTLQLFAAPEQIVNALAPYACRPLRPVRGDPMRLTRKVVRWTRNALSHLRWRIERLRKR